MNKKKCFECLSDLRKSNTFKRIEKDIRQKRKLKEAESKSGNKKDENYIDKDRAIAVVIGNIKTFYLFRVCDKKTPELFELWLS